MESLADGLSDGEGISELVDRVKLQMKNLKDDRAFLIAQTETTSINNIASLDIYKQGGAPYKEWVAVSDKRTRKDHLNADGQVVEIDSKFNVGDERMVHPGDRSVKAKNYIQCRCRMVASYSR